VPWKKWPKIALLLLVSKSNPPPKKNTQPGHSVQQYNRSCCWSVETKTQKIVFDTCSLFVNLWAAFWRREKSAEMSIRGRRVNLSFRTFLQEWSMKTISNYLSNYLTNSLNYSLNYLSRYILSNYLSNNLFVELLICCAICPTIWQTITLSYYLSNYLINYSFVVLFVELFSHQFMDWQ
jgi:hypothetical protein